MAAVGGAAASGAALRPLFAAYCGLDPLLLDAALQRLLAGRFQGHRPLRGAQGHDYELRWSGELAPLEALQCELIFPQQPSLRYAFALPAHQLLGLLAAPEVAQATPDLPAVFWRWLILGDGSGA